MDVLSFTLLTFVGSVGAGTLGALLGLGGGIIVIPLLTLVIGVDIHHAIGASAVAVIATSSGAAASFVRDGLANRRLGLFLQSAATLGAVSGAVASGYVGGQVLYLVLAAVLAFSALVMLRRRRGEAPSPTVDHAWSARLRLAGAYRDQAQGQVVPYRVARVPAAVGVIYVASIASGLLGIGGGALQVPTMDILMRLPVKVSSATSNFMVGITAVASAGVYFARGDVVPLIAGPVALGVLLGALLGAPLMVRLRGTAIRRLLIGVLVVVAVQMALKGLGLHFG